MNAIVPSGSTTGYVTITAPGPVAQTVNDTVTASLNSVQFSGSISIQPFQLTVTISPGTIIGASTQTATGTVSLNATSSGVYVWISASPGGLNFPNYVNIPNGQSSGTFTVSYPNLVANPVTITVTGTVGTLYNPIGPATSTTVTILPFQPTLSFSPGQIVGGSTQTATGTVTLNAPSNGLYVWFSASPGGLSFPNDISIPQGQTSGTFTVSYGNLVASPVTITVTATLGGPYGPSAPSTTGTITIAPFQPTLSFSPSRIVGGSTQTATGTVTLNALSNGVYVWFSASPGGLNYPNNINIPRGQSSGTFTVKDTSLVSSIVTFTVTATLGGPYGPSAPSTTGTIAVAPFHVTLSLNQPLYSGETGQGKVTLDQAPLSGVTVTLTQSVPGLVGIPATVSVAGGQTSSSPFNFAASQVSQDTSETVTATLSGSQGQEPMEVLAGPDPDLGCSSPSGGDEPSGGEPINFTNGNTWITHNDYSIPGLGGGLALSRTWNSLWTGHSPIQQVGMFGDSWRSTFEERLQTLTGGNVRYWRSNGCSWTFDYDSVHGVYTQVAPQTEHARLSYDSGSGQTTIAFVSGSHRVFDSGGYLLAIVDRNNNQTNVTRDAAGRISLVTDAAGRTLQFNYANPTIQQVLDVQDSVGVIATYTYDASSRLQQVAYSDGSAINYAYDSNSLISSVTDVNGKVLEAHTYDSSRRGLTSSLANNVELLTVSYPQTGTTHVVDSSSNASDYSYTVQGGKHVGTGVSGSGCASCSFGLPISVSYDSLGDVTASTDQANIITQYTYDSLSNTTSVSRPIDSTHTQAYSYTYNGFGEVLTSADPLGHTTTNTYDATGSLLSTTTPSPDGVTPGSTTTFTYDSKGEVLTITDPLNHTTTFTYTAAGLVQSVTDAQNDLTTYGYDLRGNRTSITDAAQNLTTFTYDGRNRLTLITYPDLTTTQYGYDARGRRTSITDQNGHVTTYAYDDANRLVSITDAQQPTPGVTQYGYDNENNLTSITDALNRTTSFAYDKFRRVTQTTFPSTLVEKYTYDANNNLLTKTDRNGNAITYSYDNVNRMTAKQYPNSGGTVSYIYDLANRMTQVSDATGTYGFSYDNMGRLTGTSTQYSFLPGNTYTNSYSYDAASNRTGFTAPDGSTNTYVYDSLNRLSTLTSSLTGQFGFGYDALSRRTSLTRPNGVSTSYSYDSLSHLLSILHQANGAIIDGATYTYDNAGNRLSKLNELNGVTENYTYDPIYQLTEVQQIVNGNQSTSESYTYDAVGNRLSSLSVASYSYNSSNELAASSDGYSNTYDANGNLLTKSSSSDVTQYGWDFENRLTSVTVPNGGGTVSFKYDPFGSRIQKSSPNGTTNYIYDGVNTVEELDGSGTVVSRYIHTIGVDEQLAENRSGAASFYQADGLGSVTSVSNAPAALAQTYTFNAFGTLTTTSGSVTNPFQYTGRDYDSETGIYYYRARYYDPQEGRFLSEDSIRSGLNFYTYVTNNPATFMDPFGLKNCTKTPLGVVCYPDSNPGTIELDPKIPDAPTPPGLPKMPKPVPMPQHFCQPGTNCQDTITPGLPTPSYGDFVPNPCQGYDFDSVPLPYRGPTFSCRGNRDACLDAETNFIKACHNAGCKGIAYNTFYYGGISAACCQKK